MRVTFVGTGEAFDPVLPNTSILYQGASTILMDCGFGAVHPFWARYPDPSLLDAISISHTHADHAFGLPGLLLWMRVAGRERPLTIFGGPGVRDWLHRILELGYPGSFDPASCYSIEPVEVLPGAPLEYRGCRIETAQSEHSIHNLSTKITEGERSFCYSGDGIPTDATRALFRHADVVAHECYWLEGRDHGHSGARELVEMAREEKIETLCLIHLGRHLKEAIGAEAQSWTAPPEIRIPKPGDTMEI